MAEITLTPHQEQALDWLVEQLTSGTPLVALRGLAGTGKTSLLPHLVQCLVEAGIPVKIGAPTHRAAMILRQKGLKDADTLHSHALTPYFTPEYAACMEWLGEPCPTHAGLVFASRDEHPDYDDLPELIHDALLKHGLTLSAVLKRAQTYPARRVLESLGIHGRQYFDGFGPKMGEGCLIIDEASMVGAEMLELCQRAFPLICLVGDPGQLPPVKDMPVLEDIEDAVDLTEIHRQAAESPIIQLAYSTRNGTVRWHELACQEGALEEWMGVSAQRFLTAPLIVWRNKTRLACTASIRQALGYPAYTVVPGEPLVCRSNSPEDRADGYYNNALYRVVEVSASELDIAVIQEEGTDILRNVQLHLEELRGETIHPRAVPFRFAYCLTAHTAQGGEWPTVYIAKADMQAYFGKCQREGQAAIGEGRRWAYTAITRAKDTLGFLLHYDFTQSRPVAVARIKEHAMPKMTAVVTDNTPEPQETEISAHVDSAMFTANPDDIPDPPLPLQMLQNIGAGAVVPPTVDPGTVAGQVAMALDDAGAHFAQHTAATLAAMDKSWDVALLYARENQQILEALTGALHNYAPVTPYSASVSVVSPAGFPMILSVQERSREAFLAAMGGMMGFLVDNGFQAGTATSGQGVPF